MGAILIAGSPLSAPDYRKDGCRSGGYQYSGPRNGKAEEELNGILSETSGQPLEKIQQDTDRDFYLNAQEAIEYRFGGRDRFQI